MNNSSNKVIQQLQSLDTIREKSKCILELGRQDKLKHFKVHEERLPDAANYVEDVIINNYPNLDIPYHSRWRHFEAGGIDRIHSLRSKFASISAEELGKRMYELVIISVLLDAGAGNNWSYHEKNHAYSRSEGLAIASLDLYLRGAFSNDPKQPFRVDAERLLLFTLKELQVGFQVTADNPLAGLKGRLDLLNRLGATLNHQAQFFGEEARMGNFYSYILSQSADRSINAERIFHAVLQAFNAIWPERLDYQGTALGDVWIHSALKDKQPGSEYIPFHKLSQWLTYSLIEPIEWSGITVNHIDKLTGLPEYRNGGLFIDTGVLELREEELLTEPQQPESEAIVEWRALTVALLDELAENIRQRLQKDEKELPLAKILQGGTWEAGRKIAREKRDTGMPPIEIISDGTVF